MALLESFRGYSRDIPLEKFLQEYQDHYSYNNIGDVVKTSALAVEFKVKKPLFLFRNVQCLHFKRTPDAV